VLYDKVREQRVRPSCLYAADDEAVQVTEQLTAMRATTPSVWSVSRNARALEDFVPGVFANVGQVFYRFAPPGEL